MDIQQFHKDTIVFFDRTEVNLKGVKYKIEDDTKFYVIDPNSYHLIDKQIPSYMMDNLILEGEIVLSQEDLDLVS